MRFIEERKISFRYSHSALIVIKRRARHRQELTLYNTSDKTDFPNLTHG